MKMAPVANIEVKNYLYRIVEKGFAAYQYRHFIEGLHALYISPNRNKNYTSTMKALKYLKNVNFVDEKEYTALVKKNMSIFIASGIEKGFTKSVSNTLAK